MCKTIYNNGNYTITAKLGRSKDAVTIKAINRMEDLVDSILLTKQDLIEIVQMFDLDGGENLSLCCGSPIKLGRCTECKENC